MLIEGEILAQKKTYLAAVYIHIYIAFSPFKIYSDGETWGRVEGAGIRYRSSSKVMTSQKRFL